MKLLELQVEGYRSLKNVTWKPGNLNVLIGPNGSGKTNLVRALQLLSVAARGGLKKYVSEQGGIRSMSWDARTNDIELNVKTSGATGLEEESAGVENFSYRLRFVVYAGPFESYSLREQLGRPDEPRLLLDRTPKGPLAAYVERSQKMLTDEDDVDPNETELSIVRRPLGIAMHVLPFRRFLESWKVYRELDTSQEAPIRRAVPPQWEKELAEDVSNIVAYLYTSCFEDRHFKRDLELAMKAAFGDDFEELVFGPASDKRIQMGIRWRSLKNPVSAPDLSDGTLRFLFLIGSLLNPEPPPLIVIEEPEIGLHPRMMSIIAEYAADAAERTQVIFTTHSPDFLSAFRGTIPTTTVCNCENGETVLRVLSGPGLDYWLKEYSLGELYRSGHLESME